MDTGVSVRKRVIKIIRDVCMSNSGFAKATDGCVRIISRINDEETSIQVTIIYIHQLISVLVMTNTLAFCTYVDILGFSPLIALLFLFINLVKHNTGKSSLKIVLL